MKRALFSLLLAVLLLLSACGSAPAGQSASLRWKDMRPVSSMELEYAREFSVDYYEGGYKLLSIGDGSRYLVIPEGGSVPGGLEEGIVTLQQPLDHIYLAATSAMALFDRLDAIDAVTLSGTEKEGWYIENAVSAMENGTMRFAGKYSQPDYELLAEDGCDLAVESTMIFHAPKVKELIEQLGIPVFVERSSYEQHPLGRTEWIRLYAAMLNKEDEADAFFREQAAVIQQLKDFENTGKTVAFFSTTADGRAVVRTSDDYLARMIEIAGGKYVFEDLAKEDSRNATMTITMEAFYTGAMNADYLIYNSAIDDPIYTVEELLEKSELLADFRAVKNGDVWCTGKYLYQATDIVGNLITDLHGMLTGDEAHMTFLYKLK